MNRLQTPTVARILTLAGLAPFILSAAAMVQYQADPIRLQIVGIVMICYTAMILSFLGGIRWGIEIVWPGPSHIMTLGGAVLAPITGWAAVCAFFFWQPSGLLFLSMTAALGIFWVWDFSSGKLPDWYRKLRIWPTLGAAACLVVAAYLLR